MIAVIDYKAGNLKSVAKALEFIRADVVVTQDHETILRANGVVLPGVGAFADCIGGLKSAGLESVVRRVISEGTPFLGICLGFQMLFDYSEENAGSGERVRGFGIFRGTVRRFPRETGLKVPHMGWNNLLVSKRSPLFSDLPNDPYVYFVPSYYVEAEDRSIVAARCGYGIEFDAAISAANVFGTQFHPEKSGATGIPILKNCVKEVRDNDNNSRN